MADLVLVRFMAAAIPLSQFVGELVWNGLLLATGAYLLWFSPHRVRRQLESSSLTDAEAEEKLRRHKMLAYLLFGAAILSLLALLI